jgi:hypothetical protein
VFGAVWCVQRIVVLHLVCALCVWPQARLAQSAERKALNLVVVGSSPTVGVLVGRFVSMVVVLWGWLWTWTHWGLNPGPSACKADVIPLHHVPCTALNIAYSHVTSSGVLAGRATQTTPRGFEPLRAEPNGFRVHLLNRSDTVS